MHSVNSYQDIKTPEDEEYEREVEIAFENLVEYYADDIEAILEGGIRMTDEEIDRMADNFVNAQDFTRVYSVARKAECGAFWKYGFLVGLKAEKPNWHKVADGDLPKKVDDYITNIGVLTYDNYGNGVHKWHTPYCEACDYADEVGDDEVIAWCEIPKYTEE